MALKIVCELKCLKELCLSERNGEKKEGRKTEDRNIRMLVIWHIQLKKIIMPFEFKRGTYIIQKFKIFSY